MAKTRKLTTEHTAPELSVEQMREKLAEAERAELAKHTKDFKQWLEDRGLRLSVRTNIVDNNAQHTIALVRK